MTTKKELKKIKERINKLYEKGTKKAIAEAEELQDKHAVELFQKPFCFYLRLMKKF